MSTSSKWVWVEDEKLSWVPAKVVNIADNQVTLKTVYDSQLTKTSQEVAQLKSAQESSVIGNFSNLIRLEEFTEGAVLHQLRNRYNTDDIYTSIGNILVSINPFKMLDIYTQTVLVKYREAKPEDDTSPHIFKLSSNVYKCLRTDSENQSVVISGESGAGKTEATKLILQYLSDVAGSPSGVEQLILLSNPILESFGNSKTLRNNNSSRFGKWMEIMFNRNYSIVGSRIVNYLLEKSRVIRQSNGERNYHVFYQLCAGAPEDLRKKFKILPPASYKFLNQSNCYEVNGIDDFAEFKKTVKAMATLSFADEEVEGIWRIISGILYVGNIEFEPKADGSVISSRDSLKLASNILEIEESVLEQALCFKAVEIRKEVQMIVQKPEQAVDSRDTLAKYLYGSLFDWLVLKINQILAKETGNFTVGILDIFGFEVFENNSFEQFCINYANEKLQQHFNQFIFKMEQEEYIADGIKFDNVTFVDNQECLDLIESNPGIIRLIDEEMMLPKGSDEALVGKMHKIFAETVKHKFYSVKKTQKTVFIVKHYAGDVVYNIVGFCDKAKDNIHDSLLSAVTRSRNAFIQKIFAESSVEDLSKEPASPGSVKKIKSLVVKFKNQLSMLMTSLNRTNPHFVRCIKPNPEKVANKFDSYMILQQLKYAGLFEAIRVRASGYSYRKPHAQFYARYRSLIPRKERAILEKSNSSGLKRCQDIFAQLQMDLNDFQIGNSKVLYRASVLLVLEKRREAIMVKFAVKLQSGARAILCRKIRKKMSENVKRIRIVITSGDLSEMKQLLDELNANRFDHHSLNDLKTEYLYLKEEAHLCGLIKEAIDLMSLDPLEGSLIQAEKIQMKEKTKKADVLKLLENAENAKVRLRELANAFGRLKVAIRNENIQELEETLELAKNAKLDNEDIDNARKLLEKLKQNAEYLESVRRGIEENNIQLVEESFGVLMINKAKFKEDQNNIIFGARQFILKHYESLLDVQLDSGDRNSIIPILDVIISKNIDNLLEKIIEKGKERLHNLNQGSSPDDESKKDLTQNAAISDSAAEKEEPAKIDNFDELTRTLTLTDQDLPVLPRLAPPPDHISHLVIPSKDQFSKAQLADIQTPTGQTFRKVTSPTLSDGRTSKFVLDQIKKAIDDLDRPLMKALLEDYRDFDLELDDSILQARRLCFAMLDSDFRALQIKRAIERSDIKKVNELIVLCEQEGTNDTEIRAARNFLNQQDAAELSHDLRHSTIKENENLSKVFKELKGKYSLHLFPHLRHLENEASFLSKKKFANLSYLEFGVEPIKHSMFKLSTAYVGSKSKSKAVKSDAKEIFKSIMGYMGERFHAYPASLAHEVVYKGLEEPLLRDEIFLQLIKQTTKNPSAESTLLGWKLIYLCLKTFPPLTEEMKGILLSHIAEIANPVIHKHMGFDSIANIATNCYLLIQDPRKIKGELPSLEEIRLLTESRAMKFKVIGPSNDLVEVHIGATNREMTVSGACQLIGTRMSVYKSGANAPSIVVFVENVNLMKIDQIKVDPDQSVVDLINHWDGETRNNPDLRVKFKYVLE